MVHHHGALLANTMDTISGLSLYGRIPPTIQVDDVVGLCQGEAEGTRTEGKDEDARTRRTVKAFNLMSTIA
jgi:hypothetical protein